MLGNNEFLKDAEHERRPRDLHKAFFYEYIDRPQPGDKFDGSWKDTVDHHGLQILNLNIFIKMVCHTNC